MKLGDVLRKERQKKGLGVGEIAEQLGLDADAYRRVEAGESEAEAWAPILAQIAIRLETPTSRLVADSGRSADARPGQCGELIQKHRQRVGKSAAEVAGEVGLGLERFEQIEAGDSALEIWAPRYLAFAEAIEQPVFNLFYPCGLPFQELDDYP